MKTSTVKFILLVIFLQLSGQSTYAKADACQPFPAESRADHLLFDALFISNTRLYVAIGNEMKARETLDNEVALMVSFLSDVRTKKYCGVSAEQINSMGNALRYIAAINSVHGVEKINSNKDLTKVLEDAVNEDKSDYAEKLKRVQYLLDDAKSKSVKALNTGATPQ